MEKKNKAATLADKILELMEEKKYDEAGALCEESIERFGASSEALLLRSRCRSLCGDLSGALDDHKAAMAMTGDDLPGAGRMKLAEEAMDAHMPFDYCSQLFTQAGERLEREGQNGVMTASAYNKAGICLYRQEADPRLEEACFRRALAAANRAEEDEEQADDAATIGALVRSNLAECLTRTGDEEEAVQLYNEASDAFFDRMEGTDGMGLANYSMCQKCLSDIYRAKDESIQAHICLTRAINELERREKKLNEQMRLHLAICHNARGTLRYQMGDYEGEVEDCTRALELRETVPSEIPSLATVRSNRAEAYMQLGQFEPARADFLEAIALFESMEESRASLESAAIRHYLLAGMYDDNDMPDEACEDYRAAAERLDRAERNEGPEGEYSDEQLADMQSLCRMRLSAALLSCEERDYCEALEESRKAIALLERLPLTPERAARMVALYISNGELLESFDEPEAAKQEFDEADRIRDSFAGHIEEEPELSCGEEEEPYEDANDQFDIWEDRSGNTPQG